MKSLILSVTFLSLSIFVTQSGFSENSAKFPEKYVYYGFFKTDSNNESCFLGLNKDDFKIKRRRNGEDFYSDTYDVMANCVSEGQFIELTFYTRRAGHWSAECVEGVSADYYDYFLETWNKHFSDFKKCIAKEDDTQNMLYLLRGL